MDRRQLTLKELDHFAFYVFLYTLVFCFQQFQSCFIACCLVVKVLVAGKAPASVSRFIAGARLIVLNKVKVGCPHDFRPIAVGEVIRRLAGKYCMCVYHFERKYHRLLSTLTVWCGLSGRGREDHTCTWSSEVVFEDHWMNEDFVCSKVDMKNAFNLVSRQAILNEGAIYFPELCPRVSYCYGSPSTATAFTRADHSRATP